MRNMVGIIIFSSDPSAAPLKKSPKTPITINTIKISKNLTPIFGIIVCSRHIFFKNSS